MAAHSFCSLKDLLNIPSSPGAVSRTTPMRRSPSLTSLEVHSSFSNLNDETSLADYLAELSIQKSPSSSMDAFDVISLSPLSSYESSIFFSPKGEPKSDDEGKDGENNKENFHVKADHFSYAKNDTCAYSGGSPGKAQKLYPPPISSLKLSKTGKPFVYYRYDEADGSFAQEEIKIPKGDTFCAARDNGRLKLHFDYSDDESDYVLEKGVDEEEDGEWEQVDKA